MGESGKAVLALVMIVGILGGIFAWMLDSVNWPARLGFPAAGVAARRSPGLGDDAKKQGAGPAGSEVPYLLQNGSDSVSRSYPP